MKDINLLAIDLAKNVFQLHGVNNKGTCVLAKKLGRASLLKFVAKLPCCTVVMEACGSASYWARQFERVGHSVKLISPQYVKPFVKGNKTDKGDAQAIAEAASRPSMRYVPIKSVEQQDIQCIHRIRERVIQQRVALSNQIRGLLAEYGVVVKQGIAALRKAFPLIIENEGNPLSLFLVEHIKILFSELATLSEKVTFYDKELLKIYKNSEVADRLGDIEGVGPVITTALLALGNLSTFKNGRHFAAFLGLVPRAHSSGDKQRLLGISKRGNCYLRAQLIHGARSVLVNVGKKTDLKSRWVQQLLERRGFNRTCCALANKTARIVWAIVTSGQRYDKMKTCALV